MKKFYFLFMLLLASPGIICLRAQQLGIEVTPSCPTVFQEFEVAYTADREIESIASPRWGALTLVRELGRSHGSLLSIVNGVRTESEVYSYRYRVRSRVSGEVFVPGTTAVVSGQECRFERKKITVLPDSTHREPQCRLELDSAAMAGMDGCIVRLVCDRKPDKADPVLMLDGIKAYTPFSASYSGRNGQEECIYRYRIDVNEAGEHTLTPQLSFGGKPFDAPSYVVCLKGEAAPESGVETGTDPGTPDRMRIVCIFLGTLVFLCTAIFIRDHTVAAGRSAVVSRFSWHVYFVVATTLLFIGLCGLFICGAVRAEGGFRLPVYGVTFLMLFCVCWLVFGELRRSAVRLCIDGGTLAVTPFAGLGFTRRYDLKSFDAITSTMLVSRGGAYEYRYLTKAGRRVVRVSSFYLKNYEELSETLSKHCVYGGRRPMSFLLEMKEIFR